ncbi:hypothetical protein FHW13_003652, partial [Dokdonella fugitiva]|nr:hypothetical protein [Dokdonella fugitiva]
MLDQLRAILRAPNLLGDMLPQAIKLDRKRPPTPPSVTQPRYASGNNDAMSRSLVVGSR